MEKVRGFQVRFGIQDFNDEPVKDTPASWKRAFTKYRKQIVAPAVAAGLRHAASGSGLPWVWISVALSGRDQKLAFQKWWLARLGDRTADSGVPAHNLEDPVDPADFTNKLAFHTAQTSDA